MKNASPRRKARSPRSKVRLRPRPIGLMANARFRFRNPAELAYVKKAAASLEPAESVSLFAATAALERAAKVLGYPAPQPGPVPVAIAG